MIIAKLLILFWMIFRIWKMLNQLNDEKEALAIEMADIKAEYSETFETLATAIGNFNTTKPGQFEAGAFLGTLQSNMTNASILLKEVDQCQ